MNAGCFRKEQLNRIHAYTGSHGTGKSTAVADRTGRLKRLYPGKSIHPVMDQEAFCDLPINGETSPESQMWIFTRILNHELYLLNRFDIIVTDRTVVDAAAYTFAAGYESLASDMLSVAAHHMHKYERITFRRILTNEFCHSDGIRETGDKKFRQQVEDVLLDMYISLVEQGAIHPDVVVYE